MVLSLSCPTPELITKWIGCYFVSYVSQLDDEPLKCAFAVILPSQQISVRVVWEVFTCVSDAYGRSEIAIFCREYLWIVGNIRNDKLEFTGVVSWFWNYILEIQPWKNEMKWMRGRPSWALALRPSVMYCASPSFSHSTILHFEWRVVRYSQGRLVVTWPRGVMAQVAKS
jgi:hypothetical protein